MSQLELGKASARSTDPKDSTRSLNYAEGHKTEPGVTQYEVGDVLL